jgi:hypothetical protein
MPRCEECKFWERKGESTGLCRIGRPAFHALVNPFETYRAEAAPTGIWPTTLDSDSCGKGKPKELQ